MAHFVRVTAGEHDSKWLKRSLMQTLLKLFEAHAFSVTKQEVRFQWLAYAADCKIERLGWAARLLSAWAASCPMVLIAS